MAEIGQRTRTPTERRQIANVWIGLGVICLFLGGGVWLKISVSRKVAAKEAGCLAAFAGALHTRETLAAGALLARARDCYGDLMRARPLFSEMAFRAQAAADVAAYLTDEANRTTPAEALSNEDFLHAFEALAAGRLDEALGGFRALESIPGSLGTLAGHYRSLVGDLRRVRPQRVGYYP